MNCVKYRVKDTCTNLTHTSIVVSVLANFLTFTKISSSTAKNDNGEDDENEKKETENFNGLTFQ